MTNGRFVNRNQLFQKLVAQNPQRKFMSDYQQESMLRSFDNAYRLLSSGHREAFDISLEPEASRIPYGETRFGQGCLLARRLVESGARFVEVTTEYVPFLHWDTHTNGHETLARMHDEMDLPIARLIRDLEQRGLLDRTLVILASEFSRTSINARDAKAFRGVAARCIYLAQDKLDMQYSSKNAAGGWRSHASPTGPSSRRSAGTALARLGQCSSSAGRTCRSPSMCLRIRIGPGARVRAAARAAASRSGAPTR